LDLCGIFFGTGISLVVLYNRYLVGKYPYRKVVDIHSWYFRYHLLHYLGQLSGSPESQIKQVNQQANHIREYFARFLARAKDRFSLIREDIEQVAILLILQKYRAQQTEKMHQWLFKGLLTTAFVFVLLIASYFHFLISSGARLTPTTSTGSGAASAGPTPVEPAPTNPTPPKPAPATRTHKSQNPATQPPP
jgi:hypothetical protein